MNDVSATGRINPARCEEGIVAKSKVTGKKAATSASKTIKSKSTSTKSKSAAGCALSQRKAP